MMRYVSILLACSLPLLADDWPTFRGDNQRSAVSPESITFPLSPKWVHVPAAPPHRAWPDPKHRNLSAGAWDLISTLDYDQAYHPIVAKGRVYYGTSTTDAISCLSPDGRTLWRFVTEGPVRLAPVYSDGMIYAGSDDGCVYCLDAESGKLVWRHRASEEDQRIPGNGRVISRWPIRVGLIVEKGLVYFCAGLFPSQGVMVGAIDAATGKAKWTRNAGVSPQGYLLTNGTRLFVPTGRTPFHEFALADGTQPAKLGRSTSWGKRLHGGCFGVVVDGKLVAGPSEDGHIDIWNTVKNHVRMPGIQFLSNGDRAYLLGKADLKALNPKRIKEAYGKKGKKADAMQWQVKLENPRCMAMAGSVILVGGKEWIGGFAADSGEQLWQQKITSAVESIAISNGRIVAGTSDGSIHCFAAGAGGQAAEISAMVSTGEAPKPVNGADVSEAARIGKGYILVLGLQSARRIAALAAAGRCRVIGRDPDLARVQAVRSDLEALGLYGTRAVVHHGSLDKLPYTDYFANIICSDTRNLSTPTAELRRVLRPSGGLLHLPVDASAAARLTRELPDARSSEHGATLTWRRPKLPGAGEWSHFYADAANTACSKDQFRSNAMKLQWFGRPGPTHIVDRHNKTTAPLYKNGRMFVPGLNRFTAVDAYNGTVLWNKPMPESTRIGAMRDASNIAVSENALLIAAKGDCISFDPQTGQEQKRTSISKLFGSAKGQWAYLATVGNLIYGSVSRPKSIVRREVRGREGIWRREEPLVVCSDRVFAVREGADKVQWQYQPESGVIVNATIAIANGRMHFVQSDNSVTTEIKNGQVGLRPLLKNASLVALESETGKLLWQHPVTLQSITDAIYLSCGMDTMIVTGSHYRKVGPEELKGRVKPEQALRTRYEVFAYDCATGRRLWQRLLTPNRDHELKGAHGINIQHPAIVDGVGYGPGFAFHLRSGKDIDAWKWQVGQKCGTVSTSRHYAFSRFSKQKFSYMFDLETGENGPLSVVARPGCWINIIPAGGLVLIPESSAGCTCEYSVQTSLAFLPGPVGVKPSPPGRNSE